jgi:hypothetical protein
VEAVFPLVGTPLPLGQTDGSSNSQDPIVLQALLVVLFAVIVIFVIMFVVYKLLRR